MKRKIIQRSLLGASLGLLICQIISIVISMIINDGNYYAAVPELIAICKSETNAVIVQTICEIIYGSMWAGGSVIWEIEKWSILKQSTIHFLLTSIATFPIAYITRWMKPTLGGIVSYYSIFVVIYLIIWLSQYFSIKKNIEQLNTKLRESNIYRE